MAEATVLQILGTNATQNATDVIIKKADLDLTAVADNRGETVFAGIVKKAATEFTQVKFDADPDRSIVIEPGFDQIVYRTVGGVQVPYHRTQITVNFYKPQVSAGITPNDY